MISLLASLSSHSLTSRAVARNDGEQLRPGILLDGAGKPTTDPGAIIS
jgi:LDH2 family malate/lactate/ureidoglycolate dehydrogenase